MNSNTQQASEGIGCFTVLGLIFVTLKLTGNIDWSWWLVTLPFWLAPVALLTVALAMFVASLLSNRVR